MSNNRMWLRNAGTGEQALLARYYPDDGWVVFRGNPKLNAVIEGMNNDMDRQTGCTNFELVFDHAADGRLSDAAEDIPTTLPIVTPLAARSTAFPPYLVKEPTEQPTTVREFPTWGEAMQAALDSKDPSVEIWIKGGTVPLWGRATSWRAGAGRQS